MAAPRAGRLAGANSALIAPRIASISASCFPTVKAVVKPQFEIAAQVLGHGLVPIVEPEVDNFYQELTKHPRALKVVALSGGYSRDDANKRLAKQNGTIASFSR